MIRRSTYVSKKYVSYVWIELWLLLLQYSQSIQHSAHSAHLSNDVTVEKSTSFESGSGSGLLCGIQPTSGCSCWACVVQGAWLDGGAGGECCTFEDQMTTSVSMSWCSCRGCKRSQCWLIYTFNECESTEMNRRSSGQGSECVEGSVGLYHSPANFFFEFSSKKCSVFLMYTYTTLFTIR